MRDLPASAGEPSKRPSVARVAGTVLSLLLLLYLMGSQGWQEFGDAFKKVSWLHMALAAGMILASRVCVTLRWLVLLRYAQARITFWQAFRLMFMGNFASNFLPSTVGGDFVRLAGAVSLGLDAAVSAASLVLDRLVGMAGMASFSPYGLYLVLQASPAAGLGTAAPSLAFLPGLGRRLQRIPGAGWLYGKVERFSRSFFLSSVGWFRRPVSLVLALLYNYGHMLFTFLALWILLLGMGEPISLLWIGALWSLSYFISLVPFSINGLGLQEVSITMLYSSFGGVSMEAALALAVWIRMLFLLASLPGAFFLPDILRPLSRLKSSETPTKNGL